jgi:predicted esterase YcpF (UPF0227 family)
MINPIQVPYTDIDDWVKQAVEKYAPEDYHYEDMTLMDEKETLIRGHTNRYGLNLSFNIDFPEDVIYYQLLLHDMSKNVQKAGLVKQADLQQYLDANEEQDKQIQAQIQDDLNNPF